MMLPIGANPISLRRKYIRVVMVAFLVTVLLLCFLATMNIIDKKALEALGLNDNYFGKAYSKHFLKLDDFGTTDLNSGFSKLVSDMVLKKLEADVEDKYWILNHNSKMKNDLKVPRYFYEENADRLDVQHFDPRFTIGVYLNHLRRAMSANGAEIPEAPFHWGDWVDLSVLTQHILAPADKKPDCAYMDSRDDETRVNEEKKNKEEKEKQEFAEYYKQQTGEYPPLDEEEKKKLEEEQKKKEEEEKKKKEEEERKKQEEEKKKEEQNMIDEQKSVEPKLPKDKRSGPTIVKRGEAHDPKDYCISDKDLPADHDDGNSARPGFNVFKPPGRVTEDLGIIMGKSYLYSFAPPPSQVIFLTSDGSYNLTLRRQKNGLLSNGLVQNYLESSQEKSINVFDEFAELQATHEPNKNFVINEYEIPLEPSDFNVNFEQIVSEYENILDQGQKLSTNEFNYLQSLRYSIDRVKNGGPPKYFAESRLFNTPIGDHYDWRFFNGIQYGTYEQTLTLHHLVRAFFSFCRKNGINTWDAHGSLLSWYWDGMAFPWDNDIDVQMPIYDLHKLSRDFNQTLVVEDLNDGVGRYFIDCGSFITLREKGNGNNNIDARFIDVDTGLYIDITGLAISKTKAPERYTKKYPEEMFKDVEDHTKVNELMQVYNCRDNHFYNLHELNPLIKTTIEGEIGYVPKRFTDILNQEYSSGLSLKKFAHHVFLQQLRLWIKEEDLFYFFNDRDKWNGYHNYQEHYIKNNQVHPDIDTQYELTEEEKKKLKHEAKLREKKGGDKVKESDYSAALKDTELNLILNFKSEELLDLLSKDEILMEYIATQEFTAFHQQEILKLLAQKSTQSIVNNLKSFKPMKIDPFMFKILSNYIDYDTEVENMIYLHQLYDN